MTTGFSQDLYMTAWVFAATRHGEQRVPGSELPYLTHVGAVAMEVIAALHAGGAARPDLAVQCALLHDTVEDTATTAGELEAAFGADVAAGVLALSKDPSIDKAAQMQDSLRRILAQPPEIAMVKLADRTVNMGPPPAHWSRDKRRAYRDQAREILAALGDASPSLARRLADRIDAYRAHL